MKSWTSFFPDSQLIALTPRRAQQHRHCNPLADSFTDAPVGTGKTFLLNLIHSSLSLRGKKLYAVATSAVVSVLLNDSSTAHSAFKIPAPATEHSACRIKAKSKLAQQPRDVDLIIWDKTFYVPSLLLRGCGSDSTRSQL